MVAAEDADDGVVSMTVVNRGETSDRITGIRSDAGDVTLGGDTSLPPGAADLVRHGGGDRHGRPGSAKEPGQAVALTVRFAKAEPLTFRTVIVLGDGRLRVAHAVRLPHPDPVADGDPERDPVGDRVAEPS